MEKYDTMCKKAVTSLQAMLEWAEEGEWLDYWGESEGGAHAKIGANSTRFPHFCTKFLDMMVCEVELDKCEDDKEVMKTALSRQYAFKKGLYEHLQGLLQTSEQEEHWAKQSLVHARGGLQPDLNAPPWMAPAQAPPVPPPPPQPAPHQQLAPQQQQRRPSEYARMSWMPEKR
jgi:hypothetical protein